MNLWIDCDTGHDDAFALLLAAHNEQARLLGVSTVHGNASLKRTTNNSASILLALSRPDVPICAGSATPLFKKSVVADNIHGETGLDGTDLLPTPWTNGQVLSDGGSEGMVHHLARHEGVWLCATGPLTNIAHLTLTHPKVVERNISRLVIMGGSLNGGNVTPLAEFNTWCCPDSLDIILKSPLWQGKVVLCPLELTHQAILTPDIVSEMKTRCESSKFSQMWIELGTFFSTTYKEVFGFMHGGPIHDPTTVAWCLNPSVFNGRLVWVDVDCSDGPLRGKITKQDNNVETNVFLVEELDHGKFWEMMLDAMTRANKTSPVNIQQSSG